MHSKCVVSGSQISSASHHHQRHSSVIKKSCHHTTRDSRHIFHSNSSWLQSFIIIAQSSSSSSSQTQRFDILFHSSEQVQSRNVLRSRCYFWLSRTFSDNIKLALGSIQPDVIIGVDTRQSSQHETRMRIRLTFFYERNSMISPFPLSSHN